MPSIIADCPHCGAQKVGFAFVGEKPISPRSIGGQPRYLELLQCGNCEGGMVALYQRSPVAQHATPQSCSSDPKQFGYTVEDMYPKADRPRIPSHVPDDLGSFFFQAADNLKRRNWDASGAMSRKVVDVSSQQLLGKDTSKFRNIKERIDELANRSIITNDLKDWAHEIRLGGNEAAHDMRPFSETEAEELVDFSELYLTYVYTLPKRLSDRKARSAAAKAATT